MHLILLLLLQQPPSLEEAGTSTVVAEPLYKLTVSRTGKFLVAGRPDQLVILGGEDLKRIKTFDMPWTGFAFDEKDEHLIVAGIDLIRIDTAEWKERSREALEGAEFLTPKAVKEGTPTYLPRQAYIAEDGRVYFRTRKGGVSLAVRKDGKLAVERLMAEDPEEDRAVHEIVGAMDKTPFLVLGKPGNAGILYNEKPYSLIASMFTFLGAVRGDLTVWVGGMYEGIYDPKTWKVKWHRPSFRDPDDYVRSRFDAVLDSKSGWVLVAEQAGLRAWSTADFDKESRYQEFSGPVLKLAIDPERRILYTMEKKILRRWKLKD